VDVAISDDGQCVATCNEWRKVGYGDFVLAFYGKGGLVTHYSLEQVLDRVQDMSPSQLSGLISTSTSSRQWDQNSIKLFDTRAARSCFGIWAPLFDCWMVWDASNGESVALDQDEIVRWNAKAHSWAIRRIQSGAADEAACAFLVKLKNPQDRLLLEALLSNSHFGASSQRISSVPLPARGGKRVMRLNRCYGYSAQRLLGDRSLAKWDGKGDSGDRAAYETLHYLGILEGSLTLPQVDDPTKAQLWIYLVPVDVPKDRWVENPPVHRMNVALSHASFDMEETRAFPFGISTVAPGRYWVKAVLDKAGATAGQYQIRAMLDKTEPLSRGRGPTYVPRAGDYENVDSPIITVAAGKTENVSVDCTSKVADGPD
jgi:hypothetical protein